jgi:hypothetical protein
MKKLLIGADPEIFLVDAAGALVSSIGKFGGTKECPRELPIGNGFAVQEDNVAVEFNIPAAGNSLTLQANLRKAIKYLSEEAGSMGLKFVNISAATFPDKELTDPMAKVFGCDPDFNIWTHRPNPRPKAPNANLRSCGGHIHVGYQFDSKEQLEVAIKNMDLFLGVPSVLMDNGEERKVLYGKAGAHRIKPYGFEYRTLSNFWIFNQKHVAWVWRNTTRAVNNQLFPEEDKDNVVSCINDNDRDLALHLMDKYKLEVVYA